MYININAGKGTTDCTDPNAKPGQGFHQSCFQNASLGFMNVIKEVLRTDPRAVCENRTEGRRKMKEI